MKNTLPEIAHGQYGARTDDIGRLLRIAHALQFFPRECDISSSLRSEARALLKLVQRRDHVQDVVFKIGDWETADSIQRRCQPWAMQASRVLQTRSDETMRDKQFSKLIQPPLWPVPGLFNVVEVLVATEERVFARVPTSAKEIAWRMACAIEKDIWGAIRWSLVLPDEPNPFELAISVSMSGFHLLGVEDDQLVLFAVDGASLEK